LFKIAGNENARAGRFDSIDKSALARRLKQNEGLLDNIGQGGADGGMRLADTAAQMRRHMQDLHSAATAVYLRLAPPGGSTSGLTATTCLNCSSNFVRCASILSGRQWLSWPQLPQTPFCRRRPSRCCSRRAFMVSEVQISFIDCTRASPMMSFRPQSRKHDDTSPSAFTE